MKKLFGILVYLSLLAVPAAAVVLFSPPTGDINFPGLTPTTINNMSVGQTTPAAITGTTVTATGAMAGATVASTGLATVGSAKVDTGTKTAAATGGAATLSKGAGVITSEGLTTAAGAAYTLTLTNTTIAAADQVMASVQNGTNSQGIPIVSTVTPAAGSVVIVVENNDLAAAFNGTIKVSFVVFKN